ncbi:MAG: DHH family phosphoesterase [Nanoarchaeota archaeon]|nr:DHH family phosphoesterase [Nanoarchaeota archaeon]
MIVIKLDNYERFKEFVKQAAERFRKLDKKEKIRIVSHLDSDGISACSILINALNIENRKYSVSIVQQLNKNIISEISKENYNCFFFTDIGSGKLNDIKSLLAGKKVFVLDHHKPEKVDIDDSIVHINPHLFGIDGTQEISGAGVVYFFAKYLNKRNEDMAHIAIIGAIGDVQENNGFSRLNNEILETAKAKGKIKTIRGLKVFGAQTKPLYRLLQYSTDVYIPGVTGSESNAIQFLQQLGINPKQGNQWKKLVNLTKNEIKKLSAGIIMRRLDEEKPEDIFGQVYILRDEEKESPLRDAKEFSTLLNACGRLNKASLGIGACLNDEKIKKKAITNLSKYKREIVKTMKWYEENKDSEDIIKKHGMIIINAKDNVRATMIGTLASIISSSNGFDKTTFVMSMARLLNGKTKISLRISDRNADVDLFKIISNIAEKVNGEAGGHLRAAGAVIPTDMEKEFINEAENSFAKFQQEIVNLTP